jgi:cyclopropane-fatty-acyl-phospholipid synthase
MDRRMHMGLKGASQSAVGHSFTSPRLRRLLAIFADAPQAFELTLPDNRWFRCGNGPIVAHVNAKNFRAVSALASLDEGSIGQAYVEGDLDLTGDFLDILQLKSFLSDRHYLTSAWHLIEPLLFGQVRTNARAISVHYDLDSQFYLSFLDETRCYTQGIFLRDDEPLHVAIRRKFDYCIEACHLGAGSHILEVGPGWGAFTQYAAERGIRVTAVTNSIKSKQFTDSLGSRLSFDWNVHLIDFLKYRSAERYDAIVVMGIMEHLPNYNAVAKQFLRLIKPGGFVYIDASATRAKYDVSSFIRRYIYQGNHSFLQLHDFLGAVSRTPLQLRAVFDDRHSYFLTFKQWAKNFEAHQESVIARFGQRHYRRFHLYLWGSTYSFLTDRLQCYRLALQQPITP